MNDGLKPIPFVLLTLILSLAPKGAPYKLRGAVELARLRGYSKLAVSNEELAVVPVFGSVHLGKIELGIRNES